MATSARAGTVYSSAAAPPITVMAALATLETVSAAAYLASSPRPVSHASFVTASPTPTAWAALSLPAEPDGSVRAKGQPGV